MPTKMKLPCVYCILNIHTNHRYVGSTRSFSSRRCGHLHDLRNNKHNSKLMQEEYDDFGEQSLGFFILEEVETYDRNFLFEREQVWMDKLHPEYNTNESAKNSFSRKMYDSLEWKKKVSQPHKGRKQSQEEKDKRARAIHEFWKDKKKVISPEQRDKLRLANLGENNPNWGLHRSEETKRKVSESNAKVEFTFQSPNGELISFRNMSKINIEGLPRKGVLRAIMTCAKNNRDHPSGWKFLNRK